MVGTIGGALASCSLWSAWQCATGESSAEWTPVLWGNHWALRFASSLLSFGCASFIAGAVARAHGSLLALVSGLPGLIFWAAVTWLGADGRLYVPIGVRFIAIAILVLAPYTIIKSAKSGEGLGSRSSAHFDSRRGSFLGVPWYQFPWIIPYLYVLTFVLAGVALPLLGALRAVTQQGISPAVMVPFALLAGWGYCAYSCLVGCTHTYVRVAGFSPRVSIARFVRDLFLWPMIATGGVVALAFLKRWMTI